MPIWTCTHVYVAKARNGYKIGMSSNAPSRMKTLRITLVRSWRCQKAYLVERTAHDLLVAHALGGECFAVPESEAIAAVDAAIELVAAGKHKRTAIQERREKADEMYRAAWQKMHDYVNSLPPGVLEAELARLEEWHKSGQN